MKHEESDVTFKNPSSFKTVIQNSFKNDDFFKSNFFKEIMLAKDKREHEIEDLVKRSIWFDLN